MQSNDFVFIFQWWMVVFAIGIIFLPLASLIFSQFSDKGYIFAKILGIAFISYAVFVLGFLKILPFTEINTILILIAFLILNILLISKSAGWRTNILISLKESWKIFIFEEMLFLGVLFFWSFIHAHQPDIHGLEKYMDFGFVNSILRTKFFPPLDIWLTPYPINYYYFGHLVTAALTKLSFLSSAISFNLMLATIAAISFVSAFSIVANLLHLMHKKGSLIIPIMGGLLSAFLLNFAGNLHTIYLFFKPYQNENPVPFWNLVFSPLTYPNNYWYPNATRFIENTIHEFPIYSNVVSDLHGHFLDIPFVLLAIALLLSIFLKQKQAVLELKTQNLKVFSFKLIPLSFELCALSFILAVMYMTNAWDGIIYFILTIFVFSYLIFKQLLYSKNLKSQISKVKNTTQTSKLLNLLVPSLISHFSLLILILGAGFFIFTLPFNLNFKPFASGIGVVCAPKFLTEIGKIGPFLFEPDHCQRSPLWQLFILYGFFYFWVISFIAFLFKNYKLKIKNLPVSDISILILITLSTLLIAIPEFIYVKDIYPAHYRANTMFKLVYQSFIMLSLSSGYIIVRLFFNHKSLILNRYLKLAYWLIGLLILVLVSLYPYFAIKSYFGDLKVYSGLNGTNYLKSLYPQDYETILWINKNIEGQPVILEAQGDSYTDYARVSANTGVPTVLGWTVHEWLWRGTYAVPAPRIPDIEKMYESKDVKETKDLLKKYKVEFVFIGNLEQQKYTNLNEEKFKSLGKIIYQKGNTKIFKIDSK